MTDFPGDPVAFDFGPFDDENLNHENDLQSSRLFAPNESEDQLEHLKARSAFESRTGAPCARFSANSTPAHPNATDCLPALSFPRSFAQSTAPSSSCNLSRDTPTSIASKSSLNGVPLLFQRSLFPNVAPTIYFCAAGEQSE